VAPLVTSVDVAARLVETHNGEVVCWVTVALPSMKAQASHRSLQENPPLSCVEIFVVHFSSTHDKLMCLSCAFFYAHDEVFLTFKYISLSFKACLTMYQYETFFNRVNKYIYMTIDVV
jgi:hypothetical protein